MAFEARQWLSQELLAGRALVQIAGRGSWVVGAPRMPGCGRMAATETCGGPPAPQGHTVTPCRPHGAPGGPPASIPPGPSIFFSSHLQPSEGTRRKHEPASPELGVSLPAHLFPGAIWAEVNRR